MLPYLPFPGDLRQGASFLKSQSGCYGLSRGEFCHVQLRPQALSSRAFSPEPCQVQLRLGPRRDNLVRIASSPQVSLPKASKDRKRQRLDDTAARCLVQRASVSRHSCQHCFAVGIATELSTSPSMLMKEEFMACHVCLHAGEAASDLPVSPNSE